MATIPVVDVSCAVYDASGAPVNGAVITFRLNRVATVNGTVVPSYIAVTTGSEGIATAQLCPNTLCGGSYGVRITAAGIDSRGVAVIPNEDCALDGVFQPMPYPSETYIEAAIAGINNAAEAAGEAAAQAAAAYASAENAADQAATASASATTATSRASEAQVAAAAADTSASTASEARQDAQTAATQAISARDAASATAAAGAGSAAAAEISATTAALATTSAEAARDTAAQSAITAETQAAAAEASAISANGYASDAQISASQAASSQSVVTAALQSVGTYARDSLWAVKGSAMPADRYTLLSPNRLTVNVDAVGFCLPAQIALDLSLAASWDSTATDYTVAVNRVGKDFYIYACNDDGSLKIMVSANATYPTGYAANTSRKIGGFHCLCANGSGNIYDPTFPLADFLVGDILPASIWDLKHRPVSSPEGMVYVAGIGLWVDIYLASVSSGALVSVHAGAIADGASTPAFHWYKFSQWLGQIGKRLPTQHEFVAASLGSPQGTNISDSADPGTTGGHSDTAGKRMISNVGCEDCCGVIWQWSSEAGGAYAAASYVAAYDGLDSGVAGKSYGAPNRALLGGAWPDGVVCGSRSAYWGTGQLVLSAYYGSRGVSEPLAVSL